VSKEKLDAAVAKAFENDNDDVPAAYSYLFEMGADEIKQKRTETIQHWLEMVRLAAETGRRASTVVEPQLRNSMKNWLRSEGQRPTV
jgi:hypothetical protein